MGFRINRGIFQFKDAATETYINKFKIDDRDGALVEVDADGNAVTGYLKVGEKAADSNLLDGINSSQFLRSDTTDTITGDLILKYSSANTDEYGGLTFERDSANDLDDYVIKAATSHGVFGRKSFGWHVHSNSAFGVYSSGWTKLFGVKGGTGDVWLKGTLEADNKIYADNGLHVRGDWVRVDNNNGIYFETWGGGWHMQDSSWIRAWNNKHIYTAGNIEAGGTVRGDGGLKVGNNVVVDSSRNFNAASQVVVGNYAIRHDAANNRLEFVLV